MLKFLKKYFGFSAQNLKYFSEVEDTYLSNQPLQSAPYWPIYFLEGKEFDSDVQQIKFSHFFNFFQPIFRHIITANKDFLHDGW
jgi:hypothetical protein